MEVFENLCETEPKAVFDYAEDLMTAPVRCQVLPENQARFLKALEVFQKLGANTQNKDIVFGVRQPGKERMHGSGNVRDLTNSDSGLFNVDDPNFLKTLSEFFASIDRAAIYAYDDPQTGFLRLVMDWSVDDVCV